MPVSVLVQLLIPYVQVYNATIDQTSLKPEIQVTFAVKSAGKVVESMQDPSGVPFRSSPACASL